ncbi:MULTISPECIES: hypothetical protein [unclassified Mesorhizobium]|nr:MULTISPECIES: hypothetical protein [unclassified Mesorhizobium]
MPFAGPVEYDDEMHPSALNALMRVKEPANSICAKNVGLDPFCLYGEK